LNTFTRAPIAWLRSWLLLRPHTARCNKGSAMGALAVQTMLDLKYQNRIVTPSVSPRP
jgi:hypothetical protein